MISQKERRAFARGYRLALRRARADLHAMAQRLDNEIAGLTDKMQAAREQTARRIDDEIDGVRAEMQAARAEYRRLRAVEYAINTERDPDALLN